MTATQLVIVESPAKAKTINKFLGPDFYVIASMGHVRDLSAKDGAVDPNNDFSMTWESGNSKSISEIVAAARKSEMIWLATDPDREGEAISWHILEILRKKLKIRDEQVHRITFNEITKSAIQRAVEAPRVLNQELIDAYLARRALDFLVGFNLSPILWRKVPGSKSAGRVQSVALRLISERESEIEVFQSLEYWSVTADFAASTPFQAKLHQVDGARLDKHAIRTEAEAKALVNRAASGSYEVAQITAKQSRRNPPPPFITSSLQQEASRRLGFSATRTMRVAQRLYEGITIDGSAVGLITYMRTDGVTMSAEAVRDVRSFISTDYGDSYLPKAPRTYKSVAKNAQEAHEAIRPTDILRTPSQIRTALGEDEARLYDLIWRRTLACQMESAVLDQTTVDIAHLSDNLLFRATGSVVRFDGFQRVYQPQQDKAESQDNSGQDKGESTEQSRKLPPLDEGESLPLKESLPHQHFTQPPPRYTEASLVRKLEELGIGRPSTYASTLQVLQDRTYVRLESKRFIPEERGRIVAAFLVNFFQQYVEYDFTANLETQLDDITAGGIDWRDMLRDFWEPFHTAVSDASNLTITEVIDALDASLESLLFPQTDEDRTASRSARLCPACGKGQLGLKLSRFGAFIGCSDYPTCRHTRKFGSALGTSGDDDFDGPHVLGTDPATGGEISLRKGPYGFYVQLDAASPVVADVQSSEPVKPAKTTAKSKAPKPKRSSLAKGQDPQAITLEIALALLALPREIGTHPDDGEIILAGLGRYGPYIKHGTRYVSLKGEDDVLTVGMNRAVALLSETPVRGKRQAAALKELGEHPEQGGLVSLHDGRYGPYVKHGKIMASLTGSLTVDSITLDQALALIAAKAAKSGSKGKTAPKKPRKSAARKSS